MNKRLRNFLASFLSTSLVKTYTGCETKSGGEKVSTATTPPPIKKTVIKITLACILTALVCFTQTYATLSSVGGINSIWGLPNTPEACSNGSYFVDNKGNKFIKMNDTEYVHFAEPGAYSRAAMRTKLNSMISSSNLSIAVRVPTNNNVGSLSDEVRQTLNRDIDAYRFLDKIDDLYMWWYEVGGYYTYAYSRWDEEVSSVVPLYVCELKPSVYVARGSGSYADPYIITDDLVEVMYQKEGISGIMSVPTGTVPAGYTLLPGTTDIAYQIRNNKYHFVKLNYYTPPTTVGDLIIK